MQSGCIAAIGRGSRNGLQTAGAEAYSMITREQIRKLAGYSYSRGVDIWRQGKIRRFQIKTTKKGRQIQADVKGSGRNLYDVRILLDEEEDSVQEAWCDCPAFYSYEGLCKHCTAVLLYYLENPDRVEEEHMSLSEFLKQRGLEGIQKEISEATDGIKIQENLGSPGNTTASRSDSMLLDGVPKRKTTRQLKELLQKQTARHMLPVLQEESFGKVRLEPLLICDTRECRAEFRIGIGRMYIVKDIFSMIRALREQSSYSYGKSLEFVHIKGSFTEESRPLVEFLEQWVGRYEKAYLQTSGYSYLYRAALPKARTIVLDGWGLDGFLDAMGNRVFYVQLDGTESRWHVTDAALERRLQLTGTEGGAELSLENVFGYACERDQVYFKDGLIYRVSNEGLGEVTEFLDCMKKLPNRTAFLQEEDLPAFFRQLMPILKEHFQCEIKGVGEKQTELSAVKFQFYLDMPQEKLVSCRAIACYGEREYSVYDLTEDIDRRDLVSESEAARILSSYCNTYDDLKKEMIIYQDDELFYRLLTEGIVQLPAIGEVYVSDALKKVRVLPSPGVSVGISMGGDLLELTVSSQDMPREELMEILSRYDRKRKFYRLKNGDFVNMEENGLESLQEVRQALQLTDKQLMQDKIEVPAYRMLYLDETLQENAMMEVIRDVSFASRIEKLQNPDFEKDYVPDSLKGILREYQKAGAAWIGMLYSNQFGGILADDMGLGKTLQVISFLLVEHTGCSLIVCPASLVYNWKHELERFAPSLKADMVTGNVQQRKEVLDRWKEVDVLITSYDLLRRDITDYQELHFFCEVIDEAQYIKNHGTQAARAVKQVQTGFRLALTGTPIENRLSELWSIFDYLMPGYLYSYQRFRTELEQPIVQHKDEDAAKRLQRLIRPFVLRRLKKEVLQDLPDKLEENLYAEMDGEQQELYDAHVRRMKLMLEEKSDEEIRTDKIEILAELTRLRQLCCDPALLYDNYKGGSAKTELVRGLIRNAVENGHKVLLFSQFTTMLERLYRILEEEKIASHMLTGATPKEKRIEMVESFAHDEVPVFCISLKAGGTGLNLTAADVVIHFDPWWNSAVQNQATDRAHRIGQKNVVNVYRILAKGTIEEKIVELQERKLQLSDRILGGESLQAQGLTREELLELLR